MTNELALPDYLKPGLDIVFVGISPGGYSAKVGKYFATPTNRFWPALNASGIVKIKRVLAPGDETWLSDVGIGFTDVVKRVSSSASDLRAADYREWAPLTKRKLKDAAPLLICFNGLTGYQSFARYAEDRKINPKLGEQTERLGNSYVFVAPNPSAANAAFSLNVITEWYRKLGELRNRLKVRT